MDLRTYFQWKIHHKATIYNSYRLNHPSHHPSYLPPSFQMSMDANYSFPLRVLFLGEVQREVLGCPCN